MDHTPIRTSDNTKVMISPRWVALYSMILLIMAISQRAVRVVWNDPSNLPSLRTETVVCQLQAI